MKSKHIMTGFAIAMLIYSASRSYDYIAGSLVRVSDTVRLVVAVAFLAFLEIGLLIWGISSRTLQGNRSGNC